MTEATQLPWTVDGSHAADRDGVQIWAGDVIIADVIPDQHNNEIEHADLIVKAVEAHDALVAALGETMSALSDIINASENEPYTPEELQRNTFGKPVADAYAALEAAK